METSTASTDIATTTSTPTHEWLVDIVGHAAAREFELTLKDWLNECREKDALIYDIYDTALLMFAAGYLARRNDELTEGGTPCESL
jgi:hypothetical protein